MYENLAVLALLVFLYSLVAARVERAALSGPIVFIVVGAILGPLGLGVLDMEVDQIELRVIADVTLALVLFIDAANADLAEVRRTAQIPRRMLLVGLPLVIALGTLTGGLLFEGIGWIELAILATILAATDAALGKAVVTNKLVPQRVREGLNLESGLNDGLCVPILLTFIALSTGRGGEDGGTVLALELVAKEVGIGAAVGAGVTFLGVQLVRICDARGWVSDIWLQMTAVALALACFAIAQSLHGSGYIAAFVGGLVFGFRAGAHKHELVHAGEGIAESLALVTWVTFGAVIVGKYYEYFTPAIVLYSVLSLTVVRMLPMYLVLAGTGEPPGVKLFLGWFGPRGLASIVFMIITLVDKVPGAEVMAITVVCTVTLSIVLHGVTANPLAAKLAASLARTAPDTGPSSPPGA